MPLLVMITCVYHLAMVWFLCENNCLVRCSLKGHNLFGVLSYTEVVVPIMTKLCVCVIICDSEAVVSLWYAQKWIAFKGCLISFSYYEYVLGQNASIPRFTVSS